MLKVFGLAPLSTEIRGAVRKESGSCVKQSQTHGTCGMNMNLHNFPLMPKTFCEKLLALVHAIKDLINNISQINRVSHAHILIRFFQNQDTPAQLHDLQQPFCKQSTTTASITFTDVKQIGPFDTSHLPLLLDQNSGDHELLPKVNVEECQHVFQGGVQR
jgi:hypothetical protein